MRVLVTGGAGFIGSHLVERLVEAGHEVHVLDNLVTGRWENLDGVVDEVTATDGDIRDAEVVQALMSGCEVVFHLAALNSIPRSFEIPDEVVSTNAAGTANVVRAACSRGVRRVVFASSSSVYGASPSGLRVEGAVDCPQSPYARSKLAGERLCAREADRTGLETVALRYFNVYGPRQRARSRHGAIVPECVAGALEGKRVTIFGSGEQSRDFTYVSDVVEATMLAASAPLPRTRHLNIGTGTATSINALVALVERTTRRRLAIRHADRRGADVDCSLADITAARTALGYEPAVSLHEGLRHTVEDVRPYRPLSATLRNA